MYSEIVQSGPQFYLDFDGEFYPEATAFVLTCNNVNKLKYLYILLNSKLVSEFFKTYYSGGGLGQNGYRYKKAFLENLPIPFFNQDNNGIKKLVKYLDNQMSVKDDECDEIVKELYYLT